jgi:hypothetical protein
MKGNKVYYFPLILEQLQSTANSHMATKQHQHRSSINTVVL